MEGDGSDRTGAVLLGLPGFVIVSAAEVADEVELLVETTAVEVGCPGCGVIAEGNGRRAVLIWLKRRWRCRESGSVGSWTETSEAIRPRSALTARARLAAMRRVQAKETVPADLQVGWHTVMRAIVDYGTPLIDDPNRRAGVDALGVDEHVWVHASATWRTGYATGIVAVTPGRPARLLDVAPGRRGKVYADWIAERGAEWRRGSRSSRSTPSGDMPPRWQRRCRRRPECWTRSTSSPWPTRWSTRSVSAFSRRRWATAAATATRSIEIRRLLCRGLETLSDSQLRKVETALQAGDPA